jgi:hypothetical protein
MEFIIKVSLNYVKRKVVMKSYSPGVGFFGGLVPTRDLYSGPGFFGRTRFPLLAPLCDIPMFLPD